MKFSIGFLPEFPISETLKIIKRADELGYYGFWSADEIYHREPWQLFALGARETSRIRFGPCVTPLYLNEPTMTARSLATLDEISNGRAACTLSIGNVIMLDQYHVPWKGTKPLQRLREAISIIRMFLDTGKVTHSGKHYNYTGLFSTARPVAKVPIYLGAMGGPKSFQLAGEIGDGLLSALGYSPEFWKDATDNMKIGAKKSGRHFEDLDIGDWINFSISKNSDAAKQAAKTMVGFYIPAMPERQLRLHGIDPEDVREINQAFFEGNVDKVLKETTMEYVEKLSVSGSPDEIVEKLEKNFARHGANHIVASVIDPFIGQVFSGKKVENVPDYVGQLELVMREVAPHLDAERAGAGIRMPQSA